MKIGRNTKEKIEVIKDEAIVVKRHLENLHIRLSEHSGTKRIAAKLEAVITRLDEWQRAA